MPIRRKRKIVQESIYVPLSEKDIDRAVEVPVKEIKREDIEKIEKKGTKREERYILIITEKPQAALKIAYALSRNVKKTTEKGVSYYQLERDGRKIIVACAVGHLFTISQSKKGSGWPIFDVEWKPNFKVRKQDYSRKYYNLLTKLSKNADSFIVAMDYDIEGEVIGWNVVRFICKTNKAKRMKFSTLTASELQESYNKALPNLDWGQAYAGETRHFLDWMYGINLSRALMSSIQKAGSFRIMSIGRVQGPALNLIVQKEIEIQKFKPVPYWQIFIKLKSHSPLLKYEKDIKDKKELEKFKDLKGKQGNATTEKTLRKLSPLVPFDLTLLQREAYRLYGINPSLTLQLAQNLYLAGLISYPRTSSQKIPEAIQPLKILEKLKEKFKEVKFVVRIKPVEGSKSDPAHPSIFPTGEFSSISKEEEKIYNLVVKRFISCFCEDAEIEDKKIIFITDKDNLKFRVSGLEVRKKGWLEVYPLVMKEVEIEDITGKKTIESSKIEEKLTQPPKRFTPASIITELEKKSLGTKATRANIIETLYNRNYIKEQAIIATPLGIKLISTLEKFSPIIIDEKLTRHFEKEMSSIQEAKKNFMQLQDKTIKEAKQTIVKISEDFRNQEEKIGKELIKANKENYAKEREANTLNLCPVCKKGNLRILYNKKFRRSFIACSNYPECKTTFSLPLGLIKPAGKICEFCSFPKLLRIKRGKKPWEFCFNPQCKSRKKKS